MSNNTDDDDQYTPVLSIGELAMTIVTLVQNQDEDEAIDLAIGLIRRHDRAIVQQALADAGVTA